MKTTADTPIYNLKAVVNETGLKPDTLRAWERRYGLPTPQRTESGHRLYSQNDIELLKWLMARQAEGMSISRAVDLWRQLATEQQNPLSTTESQGMSHALTGGTVQGVSEPIHSNIDTRASTYESDRLKDAREQWITHCANFDEQKADQVLTQAFAIFPAEVVCVELLQHGLSMIGQRWYEGKITVQQEHFASALANRRLEALLSATPPPTRPGRLLIGCPPEENHTFVPLMLTLLMRRRGWDVVFLGANVPVEDFLVTVENAHPKMVILTAQLLSTVVGVRELGSLLYEAGIPMGYGGYIFTQLPALQEHVTGHYLGKTIEGAIAVIEQIMAAPQLPLPVASLPSHYEDALREFRANQAMIDAEVWRIFGDKSGMSPIMLRQANMNFGRDIIAALTLGDIRFLGIDLPWIKGLLENHYRIPESHITEYLQVYRQAVEIILNGHGPILSGYLREILQTIEEPAIAL